MATAVDTSNMTNPSFVLQSLHHVQIEDRPIPALRSPTHDVLLHIAQTGICGSDIHYWQRGRIGSFVLDSPIVLGHESSGTVVRAGSGVSPHHLRPGDRVAVEPGEPCRRCAHCRAGEYNLCAATIFAATPPHDGTLQKFFAVAADYCYRVPAHVDMEEAALVEPVAVAVQVCKTAGVPLGGRSVLVFGCGPIGVLCQAVARAYGASVVCGVDVDESRLELARAFAGSETVMNPSVGDEGGEGGAREPVERAEVAAGLLKERLGLGEGADVVLECTGAEPCIQAGVFAARSGGVYVQAGMGKENVTFPITTACIRGLTIKGSIRYTAGCYPAAIDLVASGKVPVKKLVTHRFKFEEAEKAFELVKAAKEGVFKVVIAGVDQPLLG
ncbi:d-xylulose reductase a [Diplodia corticola]|uniref:D-xylulose reductase n=1 Tax=Diplodia corticola TaxID=236234 RepID=A0A1J9QSD7_9PEZI|nr:d-xylulose reductase a [Diplodia corticola]OJD31321.1 d-xylulose reductase a [Diplodia corticola]